MNQDPHIQAAVMFGRGRFQNGIIVEPSAEYTLDLRNDSQVEKFKDAIWYVHERMSWCPILIFTRFTTGRP